MSLLLRSVYSRVSSRSSIIPVRCVVTASNLIEGQNSLNLFTYASADLQSWS